MKEQMTLAVYDIVSDKHRRKAAAACENHGLRRFQYSAFVGKLPPGLRRRLFDQLVLLVNQSRKAGRVLVLPVCETDRAQMLSHEEGGEEDEDDPGLC